MFGQSEYLEKHFHQTYKYIIIASQYGVTLSGIFLVFTLIGVIKLFWTTIICPAVAIPAVVIICCKNKEHVINKDSQKV